MSIPHSGRDVRPSTRRGGPSLPYYWLMGKIGMVGRAVGRASKNGGEGLILLLTLSALTSVQQGGAMELPYTIFALGDAQLHQLHTEAGKVSTHLISPFHRDWNNTQKSSPFGVLAHF